MRPDSIRAYQKQKKLEDCGLNFTNMAAIWTENKKRGSFSGSP